MDSVQKPSNSECSQSVSHSLTLFLARFISYILKMEATRSSETSVYNKPTRRHILEDDIFAFVSSSTNLRFGAEQQQEIA
jgi:hypothetical protein